MNRTKTDSALKMRNFRAYEACSPAPDMSAFNAMKRRKWAVQVSAAKNVWGRLSDEELDNVNGRFHALIGLIRAHYHVTYDDAYDQVKLFFDKETVSEPAIECVDVFWLNKVKAAHIFWPGLSEPDLVESKGEPKKLIELLQHNYIIAFSEAVRQVDTFLGQQSAVGMR